MWLHCSSQKLVDVVNRAKFIFTISLQPTWLNKATAAILILRSEFRHLRAQYKANIDYLKQKLMMTGMSVEHTPSHINVNDPALSSFLFDELPTYK